MKSTETRQRLFHRSRRKLSVERVGRVTPCAPTYGEPPRRARSDAPYHVRIVPPASSYRLLPVTLHLQNVIGAGRRRKQD
jgi:hypothetical protein